MNKTTESHSNGGVEKGAAVRTTLNANNLQEVIIEVGISPRKIPLRFFQKAIDNVKSLLYNLATKNKTTASTQTGEAKKGAEVRFSVSPTKYQFTRRI